MVGHTVKADPAARLIKKRSAPSTTHIIHPVAASPTADAPVACGQCETEADKKPENSPQYNPFESPQRDLLKVDGYEVLNVSPQLDAGVKPVDFNEALLRLKADARAAKAGDYDTSVLDFITSRLYACANSNDRRRKRSKGQIEALHAAPRAKRPSSEAPQQHEERLKEEDEFHMDGRWKLVDSSLGDHANGWLRKLTIKGATVIDADKVPLKLKRIDGEVHLIGHKGRSRGVLTLFEETLERIGLSGSWQKWKQCKKPGAEESDVSLPNQLRPQSHEPLPRQGDPLYACFKQVLKELSQHQATKSDANIMKQQRSHKDKGPSPL
jgi:hypothetical protein